MRLETLQKHHRIIGEPNKAYRNKVIDAVIVTTPDLTVCTNLRNLVTFSLDIIQELTKGSAERANLQSRLEQCVSRIQDIQVNATLSEEIDRLLIELIEDSKKVLNLLRSFPQDELGAGHADQPLSVLLFAKSSNLQWLAVCILEELKKPFGRTI